MRGLENEWCQFIQAEILIIALVSYGRIKKYREVQIVCLNCVHKFSAEMDGHAHI